MRSVIMRGGGIFNSACPGSSKKTRAPEEKEETSLRIEERRKREKVFRVLRKAGDREEWGMKLDTTKRKREGGDHSAGKGQGRGRCT